LSLPLFAQQPDVPPAAPSPPVESVAPPETEYGGPAILSRGGKASLLAPPRNIRFRPFLSLTAAYDTGITPVILRDGKVPNDASIGGEAEVGLLGFHRGKSVTIGMDYRGSYHHYSKNTFYNGTEQLLSLSITKQATRR